MVYSDRLLLHCNATISSLRVHKESENPLWQGHSYLSQGQNMSITVNDTSDIVTDNIVVKHDFYIG